VLRKNILLTQYTLPLNCNIVDFEDGFATVEGVSDGKQVYFIFMTSNARFIIQNIDKPEQKAII
jgi:endonuclease YncB( thermonuclease family)